VIFEQLFSVYKQYGFVPQDKTQIDLENFLAAQYDQHQQTIDDFIDENGELPFSGNEFSEYDVVLLGNMGKPFFCARIPGLIYLIQTIGTSPWFYANYLSGGVSGSISGYGYAMELVIWIGWFLLPPHNGINRGLFSTHFGGFTLKATIETGL